jgi:hypothetical protein
LWDYEAGEANEISFKAGDIFTLIVQHNNDWWEGENAGVRGFFPANRVELVKTDLTPIADEVKAVPPVMEAAVVPPPAQESNSAENQVKAVDPAPKEATKEPSLDSSGDSKTLNKSGSGGGTVNAKG